MLREEFESRMIDINYEPTKSRPPHPKFDLPVSARPPILTRCSEATDS